MASATSSKILNISLHEDDLSCPVCFDELDDPKSLPACAHIICKGCLEKMAAKAEDRFIECPKCRRKSKIPEGGVDAFATSHLMKNMVDKIPGRKEKLELQKVLKDCEEKLSDGKAMVKSINKQIDDATKERLKRAQEVKHEISEHAKKVQELIEEEKNLLFSRVDNSTKFSLEVLRLKRRKKKLLERIEQAEVCTRNVDEHLKTSSLGDIKDLKEVLVNDLQEHFREILHPKVSLEGIQGDDAIKFEKNMKMFVPEQYLLGRVSKSVRNTNVNKNQKAQKEVQDVDSSTIHLDFEPLSIAISDGYAGRIYIGVLHSDQKRLDIFDVDGKHVKPVQLDAVPATHLYDFYFSMKDYTIIVLDLIDKQLLNYNLDGHCRKSKHLDENIKFISLDESNRMILTTSLNEEAGESELTIAIELCKVLVFNPNKDEIQFSFGKGNLVNPSGRAVHNKDTFYVPDNYSDLKMFDKKGRFIQCVHLNGINPQDYNIIAIDIYSDSIIACNSKKKDANAKKFSIGDFSLNSTVHIPHEPWMIEALPATPYHKCRFAVIYNDNVTRLDIIGFK